MEELSKTSLKTIPESALQFYTEISVTYIFYSSRLS